MIVLDANILIRAVLGRHVRQLIETYGGQGVRFFAPDVAFADTENHLPLLLKKRGKLDVDVPASLEYLRNIIEPVEREIYGVFENEARQRLRKRAGAPGSVWEPGSWGCLFRWDPAPIAAAKWAKSPASTPRKNSAPTTSSPLRVLLQTHPLRILSPDQHFPLLGRWGSNLR